MRVLNNLSRIIGISISIFFITILIIGYFLNHYLSEGLCENFFIKEQTLTNNYKAVLFRRSCGATTENSAQVSILKNKLDTKVGNVFIVETTKPVDLKQGIDGSLIIQYSPDYSQVYKQEHYILGNNITYKTRR